MPVFTGTALGNWHKRPCCQTILAFYMTSSLRLTVSSFWFKVRHVTLPFTLTLRGHVGLIGFLSILLFQGVRRHILFPPGGERWETCWLVEQSEGSPGSASDKEPACQCRRHNRCEFNSWVGKIPWMRAQQPTPVLLPGESHGQRSLAGRSPYGHMELDTTEAT